MPTAEVAIPADEALSAFLPPVAAWFRASFAAPTPPQAQGWPPIVRGEHTLILAPTGSGKTLAAFLWGIDQLFREANAPPPGPGAAEHPTPPGVRLLYVSPLKALNNDIQRNLRLPLAGIRHKAAEMGLEFPPIQTAVRSGDTPQRERQSMLRRPPHILVTTPESLYLLLTSPRARDLFRTVRTIIVDEIHTLAGNKRGVHLALSLERLETLTAAPPQRVGLSATIRPLDEVARFLGGYRWHGQGEARSLRPRPVTIVDAAYRKPLDLQVVTTVDDFRNLPGDSIWPSIIPHIAALIRQHKTTLIFANNRRLAERTADRLNEQFAAEAAGRSSGLLEAGLAKGVGFMAAGDGTHGGPIRVHHGSVARETRLELERRLKAGELQALVGTSSLELGIDIGSVDLVIQLQAPKSVAQGLQRVGRSGHLVGQVSKGRIFPTHREDLLEAAAVAGGMLHGEVEPTHTPHHPLDVLAQQIVAMVSVEPWDAQALYDLVRCASPYADLTWRAFAATLEMLSGRYPSQTYRELRPRLVWDRVNNRLHPLPGSRLLALTNGGTIPDTGAFGAYLADGRTKLGELDEEFVFETRVGDTLMLGSQVWRVTELTDDRVFVAPAPGALARMPFWRGDYPWRPFELGQRVGAFRRAVAERLAHVRAELGLPDHAAVLRECETPAVAALVGWLRAEHALDERSAWHTLDYVAAQLDHAGAVASDRSILIEVFDDALGNPRLVVHSPFGGRVNGAWGLALESAMRERLGVELELQTNDDGILLRLLDAEAEFPLDVVTRMGPEEARDRILRALPDSAVFGARFRQNAARALLLPGLRGGKRTPFWLQRLRAKDLLQVVRHFDDFPIVAETYRDCLQDVLDLPHLEETLRRIQQGEICTVALESLTPSPVALSLLSAFASIYVYEWDAPRAERQLQRLAVSRDLLQDLLQDVALDELLRPEALRQVETSLQHTAPNALARSADELALLFAELGDLSSGEVALRTAADPAPWIARLTGEGRLVELPIPTARGAEARWVAAEYRAEYAAAFGLPGPGPTEIAPEEARRRILQRYLAASGPVTRQAILARYAFPGEWLDEELERLVGQRRLLHGRFTPREAAAPPQRAAPEFVERRVFEQIHRRTIHILRREVQPLPFAVYADFLARWQHLAPSERLSGEGALVQVLQHLRAVPVVGPVWERDALPLRLAAYEPADLEALCRQGELVWVCSGGADPRRARVRFLFRGEGDAFLETPPATLNGFSPEAQAVYGLLRSEGAVFFADIRAGLGMESAAVERALLELALGGLVTNDSLEALRGILRGSGPPGAQQAVSSLALELAERRERLGLPPPPHGRAARPGALPRGQAACARAAGARRSPA
jgi:ATP-dependent Lhr-like helicase